MSQDSRENFDVKTQISIGGWWMGMEGDGGRGMGGEGEIDRKDIMRAGLSRGCKVCVNGVMHYKT